MYIFKLLYFVYIYYYFYLISFFTLMVTPLDILRKKNIYVWWLTAFIITFLLLDKENPELFRAHFQEHLKYPHSSPVMGHFYNLLKILYKRIQK